MVGKQIASLSSFQAILSFPDYPEFSCNLWVKGSTWRQELIETVNGNARVVQASLGTGNNLSAAFPEKTQAPFPMLLVWKFPLARWIAFGTNPQAMSYGFLKDRPCLVLGDREGGEGTVQYWIDTERDIPVRAIVQKNAGRYDLIWDESARVGTFWLPHRMWLTQNQEPALQVRIRWNGVNIPLRDTLFSVDAFTRQFLGKEMYASSSSLLPRLEAFPFPAFLRP